MRFLDFTAGIIELMVTFWVFYRMLCTGSSETSEQSDYIIQYKNLKCCHYQNKWY